MTSSVRRGDLGDRWRSTLLSAGRRLDLGPGCSESELRAAESDLGIQLSPELRDFYASNDGFLALTENGDADYQYAWSLSEVVETNLISWAGGDSPLPRELLGIGGDGAGDWFVTYLKAPNLGAAGHWSQIDGEATIVAPSIETLWTGWLSGTLSV